MMLKLAILSLALLLLNGSFYKSIASKTCETEIDTLTKRLVYKSADVLPENVGGPATLAKMLRQMPQDIIPDNYNPTYTVAFIVNTDSTVNGERMVGRPMDSRAHGLFNIISSLKWIPAKCSDKNVPMLYVRTFNFDATEQ